jgi:hypothetical protein
MAVSIACDRRCCLSVNERGDEVALMFGAYLATHTDRRLFIADAGNSRIVSVKLGYHAEQRVALKDVPDQGTAR